MSNRGPKALLADEKNQKKLRELILEYDKKHNLKGKIGYKVIYEFVKQCYDNGEIDFCPGYTWWKTKGKHLVDEYNLMQKKKIRISEEDGLDVDDIIDIIDKYHGNRDALIKRLSPYNMLIQRMAERLNKLEATISENQEIINEKDDLIVFYKDKVKSQENLILSLFYMHVSSEGKLKNIMGDIKGNPLKSSIEETFENPKEFIEQFTDMLKSINNPQKDNVVELHQDDGFVW